MKTLQTLITFCVILFSCHSSMAQNDTTWVQTLTFDSVGRSYYFDFPEGDHNEYRKIIMQYRMRCKDALVSDGANRNKGCGEWDYSCNTYITDTLIQDSLKATHPSHIIRGFSGTSFPYTTQPLYDLVERKTQTVVYDAVTSETAFPLNLGNVPVEDFSDQHETTKIQYLYSAGELLSAGLTAGDITGLKMTATDGSGILKNLKIRVQQTGLNALDATDPVLEGFTEVFHDHFTATPGEQFFRFHTPFSWDGNTNLLVEFSYEQQASVTLDWMGEAASVDQSLVSRENGYGVFNGSGYVSLDQLNLSAISDEITISLWCYGDPQYMGQINSTIFEGVDSDGNRQINSHLPWGNDRVYWDCGNDGAGYDRADNAADLDEFSGQWNHWAFTKDVSAGRLRIYVNGNSFKVVSAKTKLIDVVDMVLGAAYNNSSLFYYGFIDDFRMWSAVLSTNDIRAIMMGDPAIYDQYKNDLVGDIQSTPTGHIDVSPNQSLLSHQGFVDHRAYIGHHLFKDFVPGTGRPNMTFVRGDYAISIEENISYDTLYRAPYEVISYEIQDNEPVPVDTNYWYGGDFTNIYSEDGALLESLPNDMEGQIDITTLNYYNLIPVKFELMSFVTPYGIGLDLGEEGKMWEFDVTDFGPVLKGGKRLSLERGGQNQEEMDIRFGFIKGTPVRDVLEIRQIWPVISANYQNIQAGNQYEPRDIPLIAEGDAFKIRSVITGHGQEGEFIPRNHRITVNGFNFDRQVWMECANNPIYPQGGTWIYDRAGWCPGAPSMLQEYEIGDLVTAGGMASIDYTVTSGSGDSRYIVSNQLVSYGTPNFAVDASVTDIIRPTNAARYERRNPSCGNPLIRIQNTGATTITSATIRYWIDGGTPVETTWTGTLEFLEKQQVELPVQLDFWTPESTGFNAEIISVNGGTDENAANNVMHSEFTPFPVYDGQLTLELRTNLAPQENAFQVTDWQGTVELNVPSSNLSANRIYSYELDLSNGCYMLDFEDRMVGQVGQNGLDFWAQPEFGSGWLRLRDGNTGNTLSNFNPDFGAFVHHAFMVDNALAVNEHAPGVIFSLHPNPANDQLHIYFQSDTDSNVDMRITNIAGQTIWSQNFKHAGNGINAVAPLQHAAPGLYILHIEGNNHNQVKKFMVE